MPATPPTLDDRADRRLLVQFVLGGAVVAVVIGILVTLLLRDAARDEAERSARRSTELAARGIVEPALTSRLLAGDSDAIAAFDDLARDRLLDDATVRVKIWNERGEVVYADQAELIGQEFELDEHDLEVLREGGTESEITDLDEPEHRGDRRFDRLLEVYTGIEAPDGTRLLYETYVRDAAVSRSGAQLFERLIPTVLGALLLFELVQVPLAIRFSRRLGARRRERERLLQAAVDSGDLERRRIARDLHDGVVQLLAGVALQLHVGAREQPDGSSAGRAMGGAADDVRQAIRELRTLLVDIYPPNLAELGIERALEDLVSELPARGIQPVLVVQLGRPLSAREEQLAFRVAQEAVRNAVRHAGATQVRLSVRHDDSGLQLSVTDDGAGFDPAQPAADGHVGLVLLRDLVTAAGGSLHVESSAGKGTEVRLALEQTDA